MLLRSMRLQVKSSGSRRFNRPGSTGFDLDWVAAATTARTQTPARPAQGPPSGRGAYAEIVWLLSQFQTRRDGLDGCTDHDVECNYDPLFLRLGLARVDGMQKVAWPYEKPAFLCRNDEPVRVKGRHLGVLRLDNSCARPGILEHRRSTVLRRRHIEDTAQQTIGMNVQMVPVIGIRNIGP